MYRKYFIRKASYEVLLILCFYQTCIFFYFIFQRIAYFSVLCICIYKLPLFYGIAKLKNEFALN